MIDRKLEIFKMAATLKNFSETAAALGMTQPNVTRRIALLEEEMGTPLFRRDGRNITLLPSGEALLRECARLFEDAAEIKRRVLNAAGGVKRFVVGATMTTGGYILPEYAAEYMRANPDHLITMRIANTDEIVDMLKKRIVDLAFVEGPFDREFFFYDVFMTDELVPVAAPGKLSSSLDLAGYISSGGRFVLREKGSGTRFYFDMFMRKLGLARLPERSVTEVNGFDAIKQLVRAGYGMSVISCLAVADEVRAGVLCESSFTTGRIERQLCFIRPPDGENGAFAERFISFCRLRRGH